MNDPTACPPDPGDDEDAYTTIALGAWTWTKDIGSFVADVPSAKLKTDDQTAAGTDKAKIKISGVTNAEGSIAFEWTRAQAKTNGNMQMQMLWDMNPNNPAGKGKPIDVRNPQFANEGIHQIVMTHYDKFEIKGDHRKRVAHWKEWTDPPKAAAGATTTPTDPQQWECKSNPRMVPSQTTAKGFGGPSAPSTKP